MAEEPQAESVLAFRRFALAVCLIGVLVQLGLTAYYLGMGHKAQPHHVPVGLVSPASERAAVVSLLTENEYFRVTDYATADDLEIAIKRRDVYGGVDITGNEPHLYVASAAGVSASTLLRTTFTTVVQQQTAAALAELADQGRTMPVERAQELNSPPPVTDVVPLPDDDVNGVSLGYLTQALALGGTVASMGLGRLIPRTKRSWRRGIAHVSTLAIYAVASAAVVLWSMGWFGVGTTADRGEMLAIFSLISLAITASTAGAVALLGAPGALIGAMYFTLGTVISGASILPEFLPAFGRVLGENLPTGAGVQAVRDNLYFPNAEIREHLIVLGLYAGIGALIVLITNMLPNRKNRTSEVELELVERLEGSERRESVNI
ncbi:ABC transporter permease [Actinoplanes sp. NPDC049596]|uniref:ABC transporter permease n=1 Tax=unclassified Actinoplanes TaxID=2626549 RepID=UPI003416D3AB